jgi:hypothetical protein
MSPSPNFRDPILRNIFRAQHISFITKFHHKISILSDARNIRMSPKFLSVSASLRVTTCKITGIIGNLTERQTKYSLLTYKMIWKRIFTEILRKAKIFCHYIPQSDEFLVTKLCGIYCDYSLVDSLQEP